MLVRVLRNQEEIKDTLKAHSSSLSLILQKNGCSNTSQSLLPSEISFPAKTLEEYSNIDTKMQEDCVFNSVVSTVIHKLLTNCCV